jgi:hypothetical protein
MNALGISAFHFGDDEDDNYIDVIGKKRKGRPVIIPWEYVPIIKAYVEAGYPMIPEDFEQLWTRLRAEIGYLGSTCLLPASIDLSSLKKRWPRNVHRKTGTTHKFTLTGDEKKTAVWSGDAQDGEVLRGHYTARRNSRETNDFYEIPTQLQVPTIEELSKRPIPPRATDEQLARAHCPVDNPNTFGMKRTEFEIARTAFLSEHPQPAFTEKRKPRPKHFFPKIGKDEFTRLLWTHKLIDLSEQFEVVPKLIRREAANLKIPLPEKGFWLKRAFNRPVYIPPQVAALFPSGIVPNHYQSPIKKIVEYPHVTWPPLHEFFHLLWEMPQMAIARRLHCSDSKIGVKARQLRLPMPARNYWRLRAQDRHIPDEVQFLLKLAPDQLLIELGHADLKAA